MDQNTNARLSLLIAQIKALQRAMEHSVSERVRESARFESFKTFAQRYNIFAQQALPYTGDKVTVNYFSVDNMKAPSSLTWPAQKQIFDSVYTEVSLLLAALEGQYDFAEAKTIELKEFFESSLRRAVFRAPQREREIQDVVEQLLIGRGFRKGIEYDRETGRVMYSGKEFVPDFVFVPSDMFIEIKLVRIPEQAKTVIDEINADIVAYRTQYSKGIFIVYDLGVIRDVSEFARSIEHNMEIYVCVIKH